MRTKECDKMHADLYRRAGINNRKSVQTQLSLLFHQEDYWRNRRPNDVSPKTFHYFIEYVRHDAPWGLEWSEQILKSFLLPERAELWQKIEEQIPEGNENGINQYNEGLTRQSLTYGNSRSYEISVLKRDAPEIAQRVISGEISAAKGMVIAGKKSPEFRCKATIQSVCDTIKRKFDPEEINLIRAML
jgi:hypothetical protein